MPAKFPGFPREGLTFLRDLTENNDREWFTPRKAIYEEKLRAPMLQLVEAVQQEMLAFAPDYVGEPARTIYRIYRDTRFSKDKTPYKTHIGALLRRNGAGKSEGAAFYFAVAPEGVHIAGGLYSPEPATLLAVRNHIADSHEDFRATFGNRKVKKLMGELKGETLTRVPKGFDPDHPAADLLRHKRFVLFMEMEPDLATTPKLLKEIVTRLEVMTPFLDYLNQPLIAQGAKQKHDKKFLR